MISLPVQLTARTGPILHIQKPSQGLYYQVSILTAQRGRFVLKHSQDPALIAELARECLVLSRLQDQVPFIPAPIANETVDGTGYYLFSCVEGENLYDTMKAGPALTRHSLAREFGQALARIHAWAPYPCDRQDWLERKISRAQARVASGKVPNPIRNRSPFRGADPADVLTEVMVGLPEIKPDLVFGHGDYAVTNAIADDGRVVGVIDWSAGGYRDRRADLAQAVKSLRFNFEDESLVDPFLCGYGYREPARSLRWFEALSTLS